MHGQDDKGRVENERDVVLQPCYTTHLDLKYSLQFISELDSRTHDDGFVSLHLQIAKDFFHLPGTRPVFDLTSQASLLGYLFR